MNEVTKIHLGRQAFTISVDAYHQLRTYLDAITRQIEDKEVVSEIEARMAELLAEHGLSPNKVILPADVDFLKQQLGNPEDFKDEEAEGEIKDNESKKLFRDTDKAMVAGVAAGLSQYFGIDALIIRLLFVALVIVTAGWGILLYILLWLLVPEAKTPSERLQMAGKSVTVNSLKEIVEKADVKGAAHRANASLAGPINGLFNFALKLIGLGFIVFGLSAVFGLLAGETYYLANAHAWAKTNIFPIGLREHLLLYVAIVVLGLISLFMILIGIAIFRRKWPIKTWVTGVLTGLVFIGLATGGALAADVYPTVRDAYNANLHTSLRSVQPFSNINATGSLESFNFAVSTKYYVSLNYYGRPNLSNVKTSVKNKTLLIDSSQFNWNRNCQTICIPNSYRLMVTVYSPNAVQLGNQFNNFAPSQPPKPTLPYAP